MEENEKIISSFMQELRRGTICLSVLSQLSKPHYGYTLVKTLASKGVEVDTNTLYPLLRRLEKQGILRSKWETAENKPRKYYVRTEFGEKVYYQLKDQWQDLNQSMKLLLDLAE